MKNLFPVFIFCLLFPFLTQAQTQTKEDIELEEIDFSHLPDFAPKHQFGILLELNNSSKSIERADLASVGLSDRVNDVTPSSDFGIGIGMLYGYEFNDFLTLRTQAMLSFLESNYEFDLNNENDEVLKVETVNIELPVHLVFENLNKKISPSFLLGGRYRYNIAQNTATTLLTGNFHNSDFLLDLGAGIGFQFDDFRFKTELIYSHGLTNQIEENEPLSLPTAIASSTASQFALRFLFYM